MEESEGTKKLPSMTYYSKKSGTKYKYVIKDKTLLTFRFYRLNNGGAWTSHMSFIIKNEGKGVFNSWAKTSHLVSVPMDGFMNEVDLFRKNVTSPSANKVFVKFFTDYFGFNIFDQGECDKRMVLQCNRYADYRTSYLMQKSATYNEAISRLVGYSVSKEVTDLFEENKIVGAAFFMALNRCMDLSLLRAEDLKGKAFLGPHPGLLMDMKVGNRFASSLTHSMDYRTKINLVHMGFENKLAYQLMSHVEPMLAYSFRCSDTYMLSGIPKTMQELAFRVFREYQTSIEYQTHENTRHNKITKDLASNNLTFNEIRFPEGVVHMSATTFSDNLIISILSSSRSYYNDLLAWPLSRPILVKETNKQYMISFIHIEDGRYETYSNEYAIRKYGA